MALKSNDTNYDFSFGGYQHQNDAQHTAEYSSGWVCTRNRDHWPG